MNSIKKILQRPADLPPNFLEPPTNNTAKPKNPFLKHLRPYENKDAKVGILQRPWRPKVDRLIPDTVFVMSRQNYRVYAYLGQVAQHLTRVLSVLDSGAGSCYIRKGLLPDNLIKKIKPYMSRLKVRDASNRRVKISGIVRLMVKLGTRTESVQFNVVDNLGTDVIIGCDYLDKHVEAIRPRQRSVELADGTTIPIVRGATSRNSIHPSIPKEEQVLPKKKGNSRRIHVVKPVILKPNTQTWVDVKTNTHGLVLITPKSKLYETHQCLAGTGVVQVQSDKTFRILVANFSDYPKKLIHNQVIASADEHPTNIVESEMSHGELLGLVDEDTAKMYRKRNLNARDASVINEYMKDKKSNNMESDENPTTADDIDLGDVDKRHHKAIRNMLRKHEKMWSGQLGEITVTEHHIDLVKGARPFKSHPYRAGPKARELEKFEIDKQLKAGVIEPTISEWASPVLFVPKKDGSLRFCIDYRKLNGLTMKDSYPIPRMDECIDSLGEAKIFSTLDANSGYWQMNVAKEDRSKTAFVCHTGTYQCKRMPFGLTNAPASFQRALDIILTNYKWKTCLVYLDDVIIYSKTPEEHIKHVDEVLTCLSSAGITLKISKCKFFTKTVEYLGHIVKPGTLEIDQANAKSLREALPPTTRTQLRSFLGLVNVYRRFIPKFSTVAGPLNALLKKDAPLNFELDEDQLKAFRTLIDAVLSPEVLALPAKDLPYSVDTDASKYGIGCTLFQTHPDNERKPIGFWSRSLNDAEKNYSTPERECLAVVWTLKTLRAYLLYEQFTVHSDQGSLRWLMEIQEPAGRLMRWRLRLAEYTFNIQYKLGKLNTQADALSRLHTTGETIHEDWDDIPALLINEVPSDDEELGDDPADIEEIIDASELRQDELLATKEETRLRDPPFEPITHEELVVAQLSDPFCTTIRQKINEGVLIPFDVSEDGLLIRKVSHDQIVIPHALKERVLHIHHHARLAGHPGGRKLYMSIRRHMYWPALSVDCYATVRRCPTCAKNRIKLRSKSNPLKLFPASGPLESVAIDIFGPLLKTGKGNEYLLVISDRFTKLTKTVPIKSTGAGEVARAFTHEWVFNYGPPKELLADNGKCFTGRFFQDVCRILNVVNQFTTTYHPQTNGQVERYNRTLKAAIKSYLDEHPTDWDLYTPALTFAYNCQPHTSTALAPFELVLSRPPPPLSVKTSQGTPISVEHSHNKWRQWLRKTITEARTKLDQAQARYKKTYDRRLRNRQEKILPGNNVYLRVEKRDENQTRHKLAAVAEGPYPVQSIHDNTVVIQRPDNSVERVSKDRVTLAPKQMDAKETQSRVSPMTVEELQPHEYPVDTQVNLKDVVTSRAQAGMQEDNAAHDGVIHESSERVDTRDTPPTDTTIEHADKRLNDEQEPTVITEGSPTTDVDKGHNLVEEQLGDTQTNKGATPSITIDEDLDPQVLSRKGGGDTSLNLHRSKRVNTRSTNQIATDVQSKVQDMDGGAKPFHDEEYVIDRIISHGVNTDEEHPSAEVGEVTYRVRWYGYGAADDTYEPIKHLPRNKVISFCKRKKLPLPDNINEAVAG